MSDDVTAREAVERLADCMDRAIQRMSGYANARSTEAAMLHALLDRAERAEAERDAAYKAGQEEMRDRAAATVEDMAIAVSNAVAHPYVDAERATALAGIYRERADAIRALPLNPRP